MKFNGSLSLVNGSVIAVVISAHLCEGIRRRTSFVDDLRQQQSIVFLGLHALIILQFVVHFQACE